MTSMVLGKFAHANRRFASRERGAELMRGIQAGGLSQKLRADARDT
jgi:hypothetical protein